MSILKSTNSGICSVNIDYDFLINRGYVLNKELGPRFRTKRLYYKGDHNKYITYTVKFNAQNTDEYIEEFYIEQYGTGKVYIENLADLQLVEKFFEAEGLKKEIEAYNHLVKNKT